MKASVFISEPSHLWKATSSVENRAVCVPECNPDIHRGEGGGHIMPVSFRSNPPIWQELDRKCLTMGFYKIQYS